MARLNLIGGPFAPLSGFDPVTLSKCGNHLEPAASIDWSNDYKAFGWGGPRLRYSLIL